MRIQQLSLNEAETVMENLLMYRSKYPLTFLYNSYGNYTRPQNSNSLAPYLFLGFLPKSAANHVQPQGYRSNGKDYPFRNCDGNPNSYMAFYFNPHFNKEVGYRSGAHDYSLMHGWINSARTIPYIYHMPGEFFFLYEMHMGGCGGYAIAHHFDNIVGAALGLRFGMSDLFY